MKMVATHGLPYTETEEFPKVQPTSTLTPRILEVMGGIVTGETVLVGEFHETKVQTAMGMAIVRHLPDPARPATRERKNVFLEAAKKVNFDQMGPVIE